MKPENILGPTIMFSQCYFLPVLAPDERVWSYLTIRHDDIFVPINDCSEEQPFTSKMGVCKTMLSKN